MSCWTFNNCCFFFRLRPGTHIIAYVCLVFEALSLIISSLVAWHLSVELGKPVHGYVYVLRFMIFLFMLLISFKLVLCVALLVGLFKRLPDHLEMWYKGYLLCVLVQTVITICTAVKEFHSTSIMFWLVVTERTIIMLITVYFILVVRSYYYKMCKESNYYQNMIYTQETKLRDGRKTKKSAIYEEVKFDQPSKNNMNENDEKPPQYGFSKGGGAVYSAPRPQPNAVINMPMPITLENNDQQSSMLYPSLA